MLEILLLLATGMVAGYLLRNKPAVLKINGRLTGIAIYCLLFLLGVSLGKQEELLEKLPMVGGYSLALSLLGIIGSILLSALLFRKLSKHMDKHNEK